MSRCFLRNIREFNVLGQEESESVWSIGLYEYLPTFPVAVPLFLFQKKFHCVPPRIAEQFLCQQQKQPFELHILCFLVFSTTVEDSRHELKIHINCVIPFCHGFIKLAVFWDMTLCILVEIHRRFGSIHCLYLQGRRHPCNLTVKAVCTLSRLSRVTCPSRQHFASLWQLEISHNRLFLMGF